MKKTQMWIARDKDGKLFLYIQKPQKNNTMYHIVGKYFDTYGELNKDLFPEVTWEGGSRKVSLILED